MWIGKRKLRVVHNVDQKITKLATYHNILSMVEQHRCVTVFVRNTLGVVLEKTSETS